VGLHGAGHKDRDLQALRELFARNTMPLPGIDAEAARNPNQARPLTEGPTPAVRQIEQLRELVSAAPAMQQLVAGVDYRRNQRADALLAQVLDIDRNPQVGLVQHGAALQQLVHEVKQDKRFQDPDSQQEAGRFGAALTTLLPSTPALAVTTGLTDVHQVQPSASAEFVRAAKQLSEGLDEQGYPGPADNLLRAAKAVEKSAYLGGANLQAVTEALTRAEKLPALVQDAVTLRTAGRSLQEIQKGLASAPVPPSREAEGPER
jgi:hypothetical protein